MNVVVCSVVGVVVAVLLLSCCRCYYVAAGYAAFVVGVVGRQQQPSPQAEREGEGRGRHHDQQQRTTDKSCCSARISVLTPT